MNLRGRYIVFDGPDGCGKSTQLDRLKRLIESQGGGWVQAKDPGGTPIGDRIRHVLLDHDLSQMDPRCEALLFMASRAQLAAEVIRPAIAAGKTVLGDRYISATLAYQLAAGVPADVILDLGRLAVGETWPDLTIVLDVPPEVGFARTGRKPHHAARRADIGQISMFDGATTDAMERRPLEFHRQVRDNFRKLPGLYPRPLLLLDASRDVETVWADVTRELERVFP